MLSWEFWLGGQGLASVLMAAVSLAAVIVGAALAALSYRMNRDVARSNRFQTAASLMMKDNPVETIAGLSIMTAIAREDPRRYKLAAIKAMAALATERAGEVTARISITPDYAVKFEGSDTPRSNALSTDAFLAAARLVAEGLHDLSDHYEFVEGRFPMNKLYFSFYTFTDGSFRNLVLHECALIGTRFEDFDMRRVNLSAAVHQVKFVRCNLEGAKLWLFDRKGHPITPDGLGDIEFVDCLNVEKAELLGEPLATFLAVRRSHQNEKAKIMMQVLGSDSLDEGSRPS